MLLNEQLAFSRCISVRKTLQLESIDANLNSPNWY